MAVKGRFRPVLDGLTPRRGALRLVALRMLVLALATAPGLIAGLAGVSAGAARRPFYTEVEGRLPIAHLSRFVGDLPSGYAPALGASILLAVLADQVLTGGAVVLLAPDRSPLGRVRVLATVAQEGLTHLWAFLRVVLLGVVLAGVGAALLRKPFDRLEVIGYQDAWTGETTAFLLPLLSTILTLVWFASVGAWVLWSRLIAAADGRRRVRRTGLLALQVFLRHPLRSWGLFVALTLAANLVSGAVLVAWRQAEPVRGAGVLLWIGVWLAAMLLQSLVWLWLLRAGWLLYASAGLADLRDTPDAPWGLWAWVRRRLPWGEREGVAP